MMHGSNLGQNMAAIMVAITLFGCSGGGQHCVQARDTSCDGGLDSGTDLDSSVAMDGDLPDARRCIPARNPSCDAGPPDTGVGDSSVMADGGACTPSQDNPTCAGAESCTCELSYLDCDMYPEDCIGPAGSNVCTPGGDNLCGFDTPEPYNMVGWRTECEPYIDFQPWFDGGGTAPVSIEWHNGQLIMINRASSHHTRFVCGPQGKCWANWARRNLPSPEGDHSILEFGPGLEGCQVMHETLYHGGETTSYGEDAYVFSG